MSDGAPSPARLEAFSDGVIAVIITVMVLEIKVPHAEGMAGLRDLAPGLIVYLLSFAFTGIYWLNHQAVVRRVEKAPHGMQCANLGFLFCLSLLPVSTAYVVEKGLTGFAVSVYAASLLIAAMSFLWLRIAVHSHLNRHETLRRQDRQGLRNHIVSLAFYAVSVVAAIYFPKVTLTGIGLLTLFWAVPNLSVRQVKQQYSDEEVL